MRNVTSYKHDAAVLQYAGLGVVHVVLQVAGPLWSHNYKYTGLFWILDLGYHTPYWGPRPSFGPYGIELAS